MSSLYQSKRLFISFVRLTRAWNLVIIAFSQYLISYILIGSQTLLDPRLFLLVISTISIAAAGYIINDYYDIKIDLINKPNRVVIGKGITRRYAMLFHTVLSLAGIAIGAFLNWRIGAINFASAFLLWWYSNDLKRQPFIGNFVVALLTGMSIMIVDGLYTTGKYLIMSYAVFGFFMTLIREVIKDVEDLKGDDTFGCRTLPIVWGIRKTKIFLYCILALFSGVALLMNVYFTRLPSAYFVVFVFPPLLFLLYRLIRADTRRDFTWLSGFCKFIMLLGILSLAFI